MRLSSASAPPWLRKMMWWSCRLDRAPQNWQRQLSCSRIFILEARDTGEVDSTFRRSSPETWTEIAACAARAKESIVTQHGNASTSLALAPIKPYSERGGVNGQGAQELLPETRMDIPASKRNKIIEPTRGRCPGRKDRFKMV
jgi:hypothetical protein